MEPCIFTDAEGRKWTVRFTGSVILRYEQETGSDLGTAVSLGRLRFADAATLLWYGTGAGATLSLSQFADAIFPPEVWKGAKEALQAGLDNAFKPEEGKPVPPAPGKESSG